ncbi:hypothetical protein PPYR_15730 [Photinus pyralis]|uniref:Conserved oligomeric Golgi complex subunit 7 n=2 Tax=Photinus pyralis TaxID=7054 RepID=A0A1Y1MCU1_PHOPY|nr:conserved oligomeric Golgi complex subunit 7-like [Photinus pyralis]XP_031359390.1 conserved oligomeric Golgi complex subunit 7-like [Photinus pyralis]KAB0789984.1 hypothetical protein PPYR_15730 [Photinus pyralis]
MDIGAFSEDDFNTKEWINNILKSLEQKDKKENHTMSLVMKLQLYVQQVNAALEQTSQQVLVSLPKIMRDTENLQQEAASLKEKLNIVKDEIIKIESDTGQSLQTLENLDTIKTQLTEAKQGLHESDNWTVLANDLEEVFDSRDVNTIATKLLGMQQSLKLLINVADYEDRKMQLEGLKNRLEAIASPAVVLAFTSNNVEESLMYVHIFSSIERLSQLLKYYHKCQKDILLKKWRNQLEIEQDESITQWLHNYYDILLSNWHTQSKWISRVFPNESSTDCLIDIYVDVLTSLDPTVKECVDAALKQVSDKLGLLYEVKQITKQFATNISNIVDKTCKEKLLPLLQAIYDPLISYISKYAAYEQASLMQKLSSVKCIKDELPDTIQALGLSVSTITDAAQDAKTRCKNITENCGYCGLLIALRAFFLNYSDQYKITLRQIERSRGTKEDWNLFQLCLSLLQNTGDVLLHLQKFEKELTSTILELNESDSGIEYKHLLLDSSERREYEALVKCVMEGTELALLDHVTVEFGKLCIDIHHAMYEVVFAPISVHLQVLQLPKTWSHIQESFSGNLDLPDYSFSPQEYITQIGQYLMTLPQHLEPFLFRENPALSCALRAADEEYNNADSVEGALADVLLSIIAKGLCQAYCDQILSICELNNIASRQLAHDIGYLANVLEDLGLHLSDTLKQLITLLKLPADQYQTQSSGYSARYVAAIRQIRNITSIDKHAKGHT